jgi:hypothetical protein
MSATEGLERAAVSAELARISARRVLVFAPTIRYRLEPGDRALVAAGDRVEPGVPLAERTLEAELVEVGRIGRPEDGRNTGSDRAPGPSPAVAGGSLARLWADVEAEHAEPKPGARPQTAMPAERRSVAPKEDRRRPPAPGKWWVGGGERRGRPNATKTNLRLAGTLLFEANGRWYAAAGDRHETVESPVAGVVREARNGVEVTIEVEGVALPGAIAAGEPSRGYLDVPRLTDGDLWASALDVGRAGAVVVAGTRLSAQAISRARAMSIRGLIAGSVGEGELRDLEASRQRQKASLAPSVSFGLIALDGHGRRPLASPILAMLSAMSGREVAIVTDPPLLVFGAAEVPLPELPPDWIRARSGPHAGREGRWLKSVGTYRFRGGIHLEGAVVRFADDAETTIVPATDLERFVF